MNLQKNQVFIEAAKQEAMKSTCSNKHGAVVVQNNKIVSRGHNYYVRNFKQAHTIHAEISAIYKIKCMNVKKCPMKLFVVRVVADKLALSLPCLKCKQHIISCDFITTTYYSA
jgi:deoxycytidylate deaminase